MVKWTKNVLQYTKTMVSLVKSLNSVGIICLFIALFSWGPLLLC